MINIVCLLWNNWCGNLGTVYVNRLFWAVRRNLTLDYRFICFTDVKETMHFDSRIEIRPMDVPNWKWNLRKLILYKPGNGLSGRVIAFDIDMLITGSLDKLAGYQGDFITCRAAYSDAMGGSLIGFEAGSDFVVKNLWEPMINNPNRYEQLTQGSERKYFRHVLAYDEVDFWQVKYPGQVLSYKADCERGRKYPGRNCRVLRFHGKPRPHEANVEWVGKIWEGTPLWNAHIKSGESVG